MSVPPRFAIAPARHDFTPRPSPACARIVCELDRLNAERQRLQRELDALSRKDREFRSALVELAASR